MAADITEKVEFVIEGEDYSDKELFDIYLNTVFEVAEKMCPQYLRDKDI